MKIKPIPTTRRSWINLSVLAAAGFLIMLFMPRPDSVNFSYELNRPWSNSQLLAPFDIPVYRDAETKQQLIDSIDAHFVPIFTTDGSPMSRIATAIEGASTISESDRRIALSAIGRIYESGVIDQSTADMAAERGWTALRVSDGNTTREHPLQRMRSSRKAYIALDSILKAAHPQLMASLRSLGIASYLTPNYVLDEDQTRMMRNQLLQPVEAGIGIIQKGERIIDRGDIVTPQLYQILQTYEEELDKRSESGGMSSFNLWTGQMFFAVIVMVVFYIYMRLYKPENLENPRRLICLLCLLVGFFIFAVFMEEHFSSGLYIVPFTIVPIVVVAFYDTPTALFILALEVLMCAAFAAFPFEFVFIEMMAGYTAVFSMRELSRRSQLLRTSALVFGTYVVTYAAVELMQVATLSSFSWKLIGYFAVNMVLTSFAYILIFVVEKVFGFTSVVTLVELSDINHPVLRELFAECPGTFQHSMAVSNLATAAAHSIGANTQLVRAGALYHDIGKTRNPAFFTENQHGVNPHDALPPEQSARVIIGHVTDGLRMAEKEKLPQVIKDMIAQHHGKSTARYFYNTYCNAHPGEEVDPTPFTYPGPNPTSKEASLLMMADVVEAASRSLPDHKPETIAAMVNKLIDAQVAEGLHKDSPLSFRDITTIKQAFIKALRTMYHVRIAYPEKK